MDTYFIIKGVSEKLEDIKGIISSRKSQDRQHNAQWTKEQTAIYKTSQRKLKIEQHELH
jgi:GH43 family beta-xylosidase